MIPSINKLFILSGLSWRPWYVENAFTFRKEVKGCRACLDAVCTDIESDERNETLGEELCNDLAHTPKPSDDHMVHQLICLALAWLQSL